MKYIFRRLPAIILLICSLPSNAQYVLFTPPDAFAIEVSLETTNLLRLPMYRNAISSLTVVGDNIIGGTTASKGLTPLIFTASLSKQELTDICDINTIIPGQKSIRSGFCKWNRNTLVAGTLPVEKGDGHIISVTVNNENKIECRDMGIPVPGEGIFSLVQRSSNNLIYGITYPSGFFFSFDLESKKTQLYKDISPTAKELAQLSQFALNPEQFLSRSLLIDHTGLVYGSMPINRLFCFNPSDKRFKILDCLLPYVWGRDVLGQVECWAISEDGKIFGGNAGDGQLFEFNPSEMKIKNLGKPTMMPRLRGLTFGRDGKLYGLSGAAPGYSHLFSYDPDEGFYDFGNPEFTMKIKEVESGILWRGFQLGTITSSEDGKYIIMGEDEALSQLLIFNVKPK